MKQAKTYEEIKPLVELCKAGKLFDVQAWISVGKPINPPLPASKTRRASPLQVAIDTGFHSLVELLLHSGATLKEPRYSPLRHALRKRRLDLVELLVNHGADIHSIDMEEVFDTWSNSIVEYFIAKGADLDAGNPLAHALCSRIRPALGIYKRHKERFFSFQEQINIALRYHCKEGNLKWVSLMLWAGADPYAKGPDLPDGLPDPESDSCALELAALYDHYEIFKLKGIKLDPHHPNAYELIECACRSDRSDLLKMLLVKGFSPSELDDKGSSLIQYLISSMYVFKWFWTKRVKS
jgi:ankyrin repeat protein